MLAIFRSIWVIHPSRVKVRITQCGTIVRDRLFSSLIDAERNESAPRLQGSDEGEIVVKYCNSVLLLLILELGESSAKLCT